MWLIRSFMIYSLTLWPYFWLTFQLMLYTLGKLIFFCISPNHHNLSYSQSFAHDTVSTWYPLSPSTTLSLAISSCTLYLRSDNIFFKSPLWHSSLPLAQASMARGSSCVLLQHPAFTCSTYDTMVSDLLVVDSMGSLPKNHSFLIGPQWNSNIRLPLQPHTYREVGLSPSHHEGNLIVSDNHESTISKAVIG